MAKKKFWEFKAKSETTGELLLYGDIADSQAWWGDGNEITPKNFKADLDALGDITQLNVYINSGGGDVFAGQTIYSILKRNKASVTVYIDGFAASIASIIAMAGDKIIMPCNATMMVHNPMSGVWGNANEMRTMADTLDKIRESMLAVYKDKTGMNEEDIIALLDAETWMTAADALEKGFCDEIEEGKQVAASLNNKILAINGIDIDIAKYKNFKIDKFNFAAKQVSAKADNKIIPVIKNMDQDEECICSNCNHSDNCQATGAKSCICGNCSMAGECSKPGSNDCKCNACTMAQNNCCQPGEDNCLCASCTNVDCKKGKVDGDVANSEMGAMNLKTKLLKAKLALECEL